MRIEDPTIFLSQLESRLQSSSEADFWKVKVMPAARSILGVLTQLEKAGLLFNPEGKPIPALTLAEFVLWFDLVSLKTLIFTLDLSNSESRLVRTKIDQKKAAAYQGVDIADLAAHLQLYSVNLIEEFEDFPNRSYVQHFELGEIVKRLMA